MAPRSLRRPLFLLVLATLIAVYGLFMAPIGWQWALIIWGYALAWFFFNDRVKLVAYRICSPEYSGLLTAKAA